MMHLLEQEPSKRLKILWAAAEALGWSPFDERLRRLSMGQLEWAILMAQPEAREESANVRFTDRDVKAGLVLEWFMKHVTGG